LLLELEEGRLDNTPRNGVPDKGRDLPLGLPLDVEVRRGESSLKRDLGGRLLGIGRAGCAKPKQFSLKLPIEVNAR